MRCCSSATPRLFAVPRQRCRARKVRRSTNSKERYSTRTWGAAIIQRPEFCSGLNDTCFYFRDAQSHPQSGRIFSLAGKPCEGIYNPAKRRVWTLEGAKERWEEVKKQAQDDKRKCELVASFPRLEKRLQELQAAADADKRNKPLGRSGRYAPAYPAQRAAFGRPDLHLAPLK